MNYDHVDVIISIFAFVLGAMVGSFLNVCICRLPAGESVVKPRSKCPKCGNAIAWYDNIPILSWLLLGAKCRNCGLPISWQYPLVEAITGTLFFLVYWRFGMVLASPIYMALAAALVLVTFVDLTDWTIPNEVTFPGIPLGVVCSVIAMIYPESGLRIEYAYNGITDSILGVVAGFGILYLMDKAALLFLKKRGMGLGDAKLLAMLGAFLGWKSVLLIIVIASFLGSFFGIALILWQRRQSARAEEMPETEGAVEPDAEPKHPAEGHYLPFGPYLAVAGLIVMFAGSDLFNFIHDYYFVAPAVPLQ